MRNKLTDLDNYLFAQLESLDDEAVTGEELDTAIKRSEAIGNVAAHIIASRSLQLKAVKEVREMGLTVKAPALLQLAGVDIDEDAPIH